MAEAVTTLRRELPPKYLAASVLRLWPRRARGGAWNGVWEAPRRAFARLVVFRNSCHTLWCAVLRQHTPDIPTSMHYNRARRGAM